MSVAWFQHSAEMSALFYQGFNIAKQRLDETVDANKYIKPLAVVVDIDETMLDNSPFEAEIINSQNTIPSWDDWSAKGIAKALPGALEFVKYAKSRNVEVFYITNRDSMERNAVLKNLQAEEFPFALDNHLLTRNDTAYSNGNTSSKHGRRMQVSKTHEIILLIGDNLNDFSEIFEDRSINNGKAAVEMNREKFGNLFIVLPNPMYGAWEKPLLDYRQGLTEKEKTSLIKKKLKQE